MCSQEIYIPSLWLVWVPLPLGWPLLWVRVPCWMVNTQGLTLDRLKFSLIRSSFYWYWKDFRFCTLYRTLCSVGRGAHLASIDDLISVSRLVIEHLRHNHHVGDPGYYQNTDEPNSSHPPKAHSVVLSTVPSSVAATWSWRTPETWLFWIEVVWKYKAWL